MRRPSPLLMGIFLLCTAGNASEAANWIDLGSTDKFRTYVDLHSIRIEGPLARVWIRLDYFGLQVSPGTEKAFISSFHNYAMDCRNHRMAVAASAFMNNWGEIVDSYKVERGVWNLDDVTPGSIADSALRRACALASPAPHPTPAPTEQAPPKETARRTGSGFVVSRLGHALTNHHVVHDCVRVNTLDSSRIRRQAVVVATDAKNDLALIKASEPFSASAVFRSKPAQAGERVIALGFPLVGLLATEANISPGHVSATAGLGDDTTKLQISSPVQPGNSGGPLLDQAGLAVGVVVEKLDALKMVELTGDIPQNVNFAVKGEVAQVFLNTHRISFQHGAPTKKLDNVEVANRGRFFTLLVECVKKAE